MTMGGPRKYVCVCQIIHITGLRAKKTLSISKSKYKTHAHLQRKRRKEGTWAGLAAADASMKFASRLFFKNRPPTPRSAFSMSDLWRQSSCVSTVQSKQWWRWFKFQSLLWRDDRERGGASHPATSTWTSDSKCIPVHLPTYHSRITSRSRGGRTTR